MRRWMGSALLAVALLVTACGPYGRRPGFRVFGETVRDPVSDWSFTDSHSTIAVETRTWYLVPHSVTTVVFHHAGGLYVPSRNPRGKRWVSNLARDPRVRLRIGERIYERRAVRVSEAATIEALREVIAAKYERLRHTGSGAPELIFFRMDPR